MSDFVFNFHIDFTKANADIAGFVEKARAEISKLNELGSAGFSQAGRLAQARDEIYGRAGVPGDPVTGDGYVAPIRSKFVAPVEPLPTTGPLASGPGAWLFQNAQTQYQAQLTKAQAQAGATLTGADQAAAQREAVQARIEQIKLTTQEDILAEGELAAAKRTLAAQISQQTELQLAADDEYFAATLQSTILKRARVAKETTALDLALLDESETGKSAVLQQEITAALTKRTVAEKVRLGVAQATLKNENNSLEVQAQLKVAEAEVLAATKERAAAITGAAGATTAELGANAGVRPPPVVPPTEPPVVVPGDTPSGGGGGLLGGSVLKSFGFATAAAGVFTAITAIKTAVTEANKLEFTLNQIQQEFISTDQAAQFPEFKKSIIEISTSSGIAASEVAQIALQLKGAFGDTQTAITNTASAIKLALVSGLGVKDITDFATATAKSLGVSFQQIGDNALGLQERTGVLAKETIGFVGDIAPVANEVGLSLQKISAIGAIAQQQSGKSGSALAENFSRVLPQIQKNGSAILELYNRVPALQSKFQDVGNALSAGQSGKVFEQLIQDYGSLDKATQNYVITLLGGRREAGALIPVLQNAAKYNKLVADSANDAGKTNEYFARAQASLSVELKKARTELNNFFGSLLRGGLADGLKDVLLVVGQLAKALAIAAAGAAGLNQALHGIPLDLIEILAAAKLLITFGPQLAGFVAKAGSSAGQGVGNLFRPSTYNWGGAKTDATDGVTKTTTADEAAATQTAAADAFAATTTGAGDVFASTVTGAGATFVGEQGAAVAERIAAEQAAMAGRLTAEQAAAQVAAVTLEEGAAAAAATLAEGGAAGGAGKLAGGLAEGGGVAAGGGGVAAGLTAEQAAAQVAAVTGETAATDAAALGTGVITGPETLGISVALAAGVIAWNHWRESANAAKKAQEEFLKAFNTDGGSIGKNVNALEAWRFKADGITQALDKSKVSIAEFNKAIEGGPNSSAFQNVGASLSLNGQYNPILANQIAQLQKQAQEARNNYQSFKASNKFADQLVGQLPGAAPFGTPGAADNQKLINFTDFANSRAFNGGLADKIFENPKAAVTTDAKGAKEQVDAIRKALGDGSNKAMNEMVAEYIKVLKANPATQTFAANVQKAADNAKKGITSSAADLKGQVEDLQTVQALFQAGAEPVRKYVAVLSSTIDAYKQLKHPDSQQKLDLATYQKTLADTVTAASKSQQDIVTFLDDLQGINVSALDKLKEALSNQKKSKGFTDAGKIDAAKAVLQAQENAFVEGIQISGGQGASVESRLATVTAGLTPDKSAIDTLTAQYKKLKTQGYTGTFAAFKKINNKQIEDLKNALLTEANRRELLGQSSATGTEAAVQSAQAAADDAQRRVTDNKDPKLLGDLQLTLDEALKKLFDAQRLEAQAVIARADQLAIASATNPVSRTAAEAKAAVDQAAAAAANHDDAGAAAAAVATVNANHASIQNTRDIAAAKAAYAKSQANNPLAQAAADGAAADLALANALADGGGKQSAAYYAALAQKQAADRSGVTALRAIADAKLAYTKTLTNDPVVQTFIDAQQADQNLQRALADGDQAGVFTALAAKNTAIQAQIKNQQAMYDAINNYAVSLANFTGDAVAAATFQVDAAAQHLADAIKNKDGEAAINNARAGLVTANAGLRDANFQKQLDAIDLGLALGRESTAQAIVQLTALASIPTNTTKQTNDLLVKIYDLKKSLNADLAFNLPTNLTLPTLYEARRFNQSGGNQATSNYDNRNVTITVNSNSDPQAIATEIVTQLSAPPRVGTRPRTY